MMREVVTYGASSSRIDPEYARAARTLGELLAREGLGVVCGGGRGGLMAAVTEGAIGCGGHVAGVLPDFMMQRGWNHPALSETVVTDGMHSRKATMLRRSAAAVAMPGGIGTFEELMEALTWKQLKLWSGPIVILNTLGYYDSLIAMLGRATADRFMRPGSDNLFHTVSTPGEAVEFIIRNI